MSTYKQKGQYYAFSVLTSASPQTWELLACVSKKSFQIAVKVIDATSDCGPDYLPGFGDSTFSLSGYLTYNEAGVLSGETLFNYANNATIGTFKLAPVGSPVTGDLTRTFGGFVSKYKEDESTDTANSFDCDFQVQGDIIQVIAP